VGEHYRIDAVAFDDPRAVALRQALVADMDERYGPSHDGEPVAVSEERRRVLEVHADEVVATLLAVDDEGEPLGHALLRRLGGEWEIKRVMVAERARRRGVGRALTLDAVARARAAGAERVILQTGSAQPEAVALYPSLGFTPIPVYEPYVETMPRSLCFEYAF
jgi:GNAT superfamily N-acetyltransferase